MLNFGTENSNQTYSQNRNVIPTVQCIHELYVGTLSTKHQHEQVIIAGFASGWLAGSWLPDTQGRSTLSRVQSLH